MTFNDKVAIVFGGAVGIGAETVRKLASAGAKVSICDINQKDGEHLASEVGGIFSFCDVSKDESVSNAIRDCVERLGTPTFAHLNSGVMTAPSDAPFQPMHQTSPEDYRRVMSINVDGVFYGLRHLIPIMSKSDGAITVTASRGGLVATPFDPIYAASKAAVIQLVRSVSAANAKLPLRINALCPGTVDTGMLSDLVRKAGVPLISPAEMAEEVISLMRDGDNGEVRAKLHGKPSFAIGAFDSELQYQAPEG